MAAASPHPHSEYSFEDPSQPNTRLPFPSLSDLASIDLSVVVPAYNESVRLPSMLDEALTYLSSRVAREKQPPFTYELLIVDDGSTDDTAAVVMRYVKRHGVQNVRLLRLQHNCGKGAAVKNGALSSRGRFILMADADAATVFSDVEKLERAIADERYDVAIGSRAHLAHGGGDKQGRSPLRKFVSVVFNLVVKTVGGVHGIQDTQCGFKLYSRRAARVAFSGQMLRRWAFDVENLYRVQSAGMKVVEVPVNWTEVPGSKLSVIKATVNMLLDMITMRYRYWTGAWRVTLPAVQPSSAPR
ncbi:dolichyl-phosphate beta-glucosyltransferase [Gracilaria domingensis]|nr:dolichyl-phosphate beta-glucosyltransferase [Gracilaria domingensis]